MSRGAAWVALVVCAAAGVPSAFFAGTLVSAMTEKGALFGSGGEGVGLLVMVLIAVACAVAFGAAVGARTATRVLARPGLWRAVLAAMAVATIVGAVEARL